MREIIINQNEELLTTLLVENGIVLEKYEEHNNQTRIEGNIYIGKVQNVLPGMQAAFIDIGETKNTFIHLKDILPKIDEKKENVEEILKGYDIKKVIKPGMNILVQVKRDATNKKGARVSTHISIPTRFGELMPNADFITVSQKIEKEEEKNRLIEIAKEILPEGYGTIIRTSAEGKSKDIIEKDFKSAIDKWNKILKSSKEEKQAPKLIYKSPDLIEKFILDIIEQKIDRILINNKKLQEKVNKILKDIENENIEVILKENENLLKMYDIDNQLEKCNNRKIWLKCGGFITIDSTEALTAIDVNSGKYVGTKDLEQTVFTVNKEASIEIAKQLRLRDIGGIIVIDYIDMKEEENKKKIIEIFEDNLKKDRSKTQVVGFTKLNLLEMTRKHIISND